MSDDEVWIHYFNGISRKVLKIYDMKIMIVMMIKVQLDIMNYLKLLLM